MFLLGVERAHIPAKPSGLWAACKGLFRQITGTPASQVAAAGIKTRLSGGNVCQSVLGAAPHTSGFSFKKKKC